jgi:hypothetical protein
VLLGGLAVPDVVDGVRVGGVALATAPTSASASSRAHPVGALDGLAGLEVLVDLEEVLDLQLVELADVADVAEVRVARIAGDHAQQLLVGPGLVGHAEHADGAAGDQAAGEGRLVEQHQGVQRVAVPAEGALHEPVVGRVAGAGEQPPVQADAPGVVVHLVLVALPLRDLDGDVELHGDSPLGPVLGLGRADA